MRHQKRWTLQKLRKRLELISSLVYRRRWPIKSFECLELKETRPKPPTLSEIDLDLWERIDPGDYWLGPSSTFLLRSTFSARITPVDSESLALFLPIGEAGDFSHPEAVIYVDQERVASCDRHHQEVSLPEIYWDGQTHNLLLHGWTGGTRQSETSRLQMKQSWVVTIYEPLRELMAYARVALGVSEQLSDNNPIRHNLLNAVDRAVLSLDTRAPIEDGFYLSVPLALNLLKQEISEAGHPLDVDITAVGHAHLDVAWLWTLAETRRKAGKTFISMLRLMDTKPDFRFTQSQPQLYEFVKNDYPALFEGVKERVDDGRWEATGGMWVEADCNLTGAEALVRQFLLGRAFYRDNFGEGSESPILWLPDVFGYTANLPQLLKQAGLSYFFTIKIGWNQYNRLPYDSFWWKGIDGTRVLTHFSPTKQPDSAMVSTYNSDASPGQIMSTWTNFQQKDLAKVGRPPSLLMSYGYGDGGGGPTTEMIENIHILRSFPGAPRVRFGSALDFFQELEKSVGNELPTWNGELYLEYHRGTYTTQGRTKRANRKSEILLHDTEFVAAAASVLSEGYSYPHKELTSAWKLLCLNQFHDILPGSSIGQVYADANKQYSELTSSVMRLRDQALESLLTNFEANCVALVINPSPFAQNVPVLITKDNDPPSVSLSAGGAALEIQETENGWLLDAGTLPAYSVVPLFQKSPETSLNGPISNDLRANARFLENGLLRVELNAAGDIVRIFDKTLGREIVSAGEIANQFQLFEDRPRIPDAWDIDIFFDDKMWAAEPADSVVVTEAGPLRATIEIRRRLSASDMVQRISLYRGSPILVFDTEIDWKERHTLLKVAFPVEVLSPFASYEIQWGHVQRPTHENTSWDWARFESCAHKWVDLSEGGYGVTLINDCKYGHDIHDNTIRLTLLRGTTDPDPKADEGQHRFSYALLPHTGPLDALSIAAAYGFNDPPISHFGHSSDNERNTLANQLAGASIFSCNSNNIVIETIKRAEDGRGLIIRFYESMRKRGTVQISSPFRLESVWRTDLLEADLETIKTDGNHFELQYKPFEITTIRVILASGK